MPGKKLIVAGVVLVVLLGAGAALWTQPCQLWTGDVLRGRSQADKARREAWIARTVALGNDCTGSLFDVLGRSAEQPAANALAALDALGRHWGPADPNTAELAG